MNKHHLYNWPATCREQYLLLGDSLVKYMNKCRHMRVVAMPGARAYDVFTRLLRDQIRLERYAIILCAVGTNDVANKDCTASQVADFVMTLVYYIRKANPTAVIAISGMLIRPKDLATPIEYKRRLANTILEKMCKRIPGIYFLRSWKCLMTRSGIRARCYARDGLHLNRTGARHLYNYYKGNMTNFEGQMRL
jgi:lysophospholipase L1-like esterase